MVDNPNEEAHDAKVGTGANSADSGNPVTGSSVTGSSGTGHSANSSNPGRGNSGTGNAARLAHDEKEGTACLPPPSPAHRAALAQNISNSLAPPPKVTGPRKVPIGQTEIKKTNQSSQAQSEGQEQSIEIELGDGQLSSRRNPLSESGKYVGKMPRAEKNEPVVFTPQARALSANAARLIAKRRAMMEGQDQAGSFKLPGSGPGPDTTN